MINKRALITTKKLMLIVIGIIPVIYQIVNSLGLNSNFIYLGLVLINLLFLLKLNSNVSFNKNVVFVSLNFIIAYIMLPMVFNTIGNINLINSLLYLGLFLLFITSLTIITVFFKKKDFIYILISCLIGNSLFLIYTIISNINQITSRNILSVLDGNRKSRADFAFGHPNTAAMFIFVEIILLYLVFIKFFNKKHLGSALIIMFILPMLATSSRTALYGLLLFFILEILRKIFFKLEIRKRILSFYIIIPPILILILDKFNLTFFLSSSSGRNNSVEYNLRYIIDSNRLLTGFGPTPVSSISRTLPIKISDTWYITHILSFGLISLIIISINMIYLLILFINKSNYKNGYVVSLIIVLLFYSGAENVLFVPGTIFSWVFWMLIYLELKFIEE